MREEDDATTQVPDVPVGAPSGNPRDAPPNVPPGPTAATQQQQQDQQHAAPPQHAVPPQYVPPPTQEAAFIMRFAEMFAQSMQQSNMRMEQLLGQQTAFMNHVLATNAQSHRRSQQKKGNPPTFDGKPNEDPDHYLYSTEKYYSADCGDAMQAPTSEFVTLVYSNLGPVAQAFFHELETSMTNADGTCQPIPWELFKTKFRERFREKDFEFKLLTKLMLRPTGTQQEYTTRFLYLLSQLPPLPEFIKRWLYQQNLRSETSAFVSQNVPENLSEVIELAQRFEDSRRTQPASQAQGQAPGKGKSKGKTGASDGKKSSDKSDAKTNGERWCAFCSVLTHNTADCRKKKAAEAAAAGSRREAPPKNG
jgi:hypothetical protein